MGPRLTWDLIHVSPLRGTLWISRSLPHPMLTAHQISQGTPGFSLWDHLWDLWLGPGYRVAVWQVNHSTSQCSISLTQLHELVQNGTDTLILGDSNNNYGQGLHKMYFPKLWAQGVTMYVKLPLQLGRTPFSSSKKFPWKAAISLTLTAHPWPYHLAFCHCRLVWPILEFCMNGIIQYLAFFQCLASFN